jgi:hypothetical protein
MAIAGWRFTHEGFLALQGRGEPKSTRNSIFRRMRLLRLAAIDMKKTEEQCGEVDNGPRFDRGDN